MATARETQSSESNVPQTSPSSEFDGGMRPQEAPPPTESSIGGRSAQNYFFALSRVALRRWKLFVFVCAVAGGISVWVSVGAPREWVVPFAFVSESDRDVGAGGSLASELGLGSSSSDSPDFYVDLLKTNEALLPLLAKRYLTSKGDSVGLVQLLGLRSGTPTERDAYALKALHGRIVPTASRRSGVVSVAVRLPDALVAKTVADDLLDAINTVNDRVRQTKGRNDRVFAEERLGVVRGELRSAEDALRNYLERNRFLASSPSLQVDRMRLERDVTVKNATLEDVQLAYEAARREEVKNTPRISIIERPRVPALGQPRSTLRKALLSAVIAALFTLWLTYQAEFHDGSVSALFRANYTRLRRSLAGPGEQLSELPATRRA